MCFYNLPTNPNLKPRILATAARALLLCIHNSRCCKECSRALFRDDGPSILSQVLKGLHTLIIDLDLWRLEVSGCKVRRLQFQDKWGAFISMRLQTKLHWCMPAASPRGVSKQGPVWFNLRIIEVDLWLLNACTGYGFWNGQCWWRCEKFWCL